MEYLRWLGAARVAFLWRARLNAILSVVASGRYQGSVKRQSDGASYLEAIVLGTVAGNQVSVTIFEQLGGSLPTTPQYTGSATLLGASPLIFKTSDAVANRLYLMLPFGSSLLSFSKSTYHDPGRGVMTVSGILAKV